jgi:hypothetical protein
MAAPNLSGQVLSHLDIVMKLLALPRTSYLFFQTLRWTSRSARSLL